MERVASLTETEKKNSGNKERLINREILCTCGTYEETRNIYYIPIKSLMSRSHFGDAGIDG
jgi:hypothetical protein